MTLLDVTIPAATWVGIGITAIMGLLMFLMKSTFTDIKDNVKENKEAIEDLTEKLDGEKLNNEKALRLIDGKVNDLHINILNRLDEIKDKFNELRK